MVFNWILKIDTLQISRVLHAILSSQDLCTEDSSHLDLSHTQLHMGVYHVPPWCPLFILWPRNSPKSSWGNYMSYLVFFPSLRNYCPSYLIYIVLKIIIAYIFFFTFLWLFRWEYKSIPFYFILTGNPYIFILMYTKI